MTRFPIALAVSFLLMLFAEQACADGKRVALVVGVSAYESVPALANAVNDASAMSDLFRKAGFDVVTARVDVGNLAFKRAIREFEDTVSDADIAVVYYAGHGIEVRDQNYLIPADAKLANERDVEDEAIALDRIIAALEPAKRLRLVILDACRDNPFAGKMKRRVATRAIGSGLGKVEPQMSDTLVAYAAKEKAVANDGNGVHSPFTTALIDNLTVPGLDIRLAFGRVRDEVLKATGHQQEPFVYGSLGGGTVALVPAPDVPAAALSNADTAKSDYELVERVGKKEAWEVYLNTHKTGLYADLARVQLAKLSEPQGLVKSDAPAAPPESATRDAPKVEAPAVAVAAAEQKTWDKLKTSTDQAAIRTFIEKFPSSPLVGLAQERLATLERLAREREAARQREEEDRQKKVAEAERLRLEREAVRHREEEQRAKAAELARQKAEALAAAKQREAEERAHAAEARARQREEEERAKAAAIAERKREAEEKTRAAETARQKDLAEAAERARLADEAAEAAATEKVTREAAEKARAAETVAAKNLAEERVKAAAAEREKAKAADAARKRDENELKEAEARRETARAEAEAEHRKAAAAARDAAERQAERAAAVRKREAAEAAREAAEEAAASRRKASAEASRRQAERTAAEQRRRAAREAARPAKPRPVVQTAPAPRRPSGGSGGGYGDGGYGGGGYGGGAAPTVGIGF